MKPTFTLFLLLTITANLFAQNKLKFYNTEGKEIEVDPNSTYVDIERNLGKQLAKSSLGKGNDLHTVLYTPLSHVAVAVETTNPASLKSDLDAFNLQPYYGKLAFQKDYDLLKNSISKVKEFIDVVGKPLLIDTNYENSTLKQDLYYKNFILHFYAGLLLDYSIIDLAGAKKQQFGISDFEMNFDEYDSKIVNGFKINLENFSSKKIKYVYITVKATNAVDDVVGTKTVTAIGPINPGEKSPYNWDSIFYSSVINSLDITHIKVKYFDGTIKILQGAVVNTIFTHYRPYFPK